MTIPELLSPAGDMECLQAAVLYGASAVYLGAKEMGMRASPKNFDSAQLEEAVGYCHGRGVKVYLTCNTLPSNEEADRLPGFIRRVAATGVDALIVADIGTLMLARREAPGLELHISTQCGVVNYRTATELYHLGASRVVLARELPLEEIRIIRDKTPPGLGIEAFVHGAMCMSFSGRCLISQYLTGRDANRGECAQPCRWGYHLVEEKRPGQYLPVFEDETGSYILNAQDLSMLPHLDKLAAAGVDSFKIEGRAKSSYYVAAITGAYHQAIDLYSADPLHYNPPPALLAETKKVSHRQYSTGFYLQDAPPRQYYESGGYIRDWELVATVDGWQDGWILCTERNRFVLGEELEVLRPDGPPFAFCVDAIQNEEGEALEVACHPMMRLRVRCERPVAAGGMLRRFVAGG